MKNLKRKPYVSSYIDTINKLQSPYYDIMKISENCIINIAPSKRNKNQNLNVTIKLISYEL